MKKTLTTPLTVEDLKDLRAGDDVYITGYVYTQGMQLMKGLLSY